MPVLSNQRHEKFRQELAQGKSATEAYVLAGYRPNRHNAARLKSFEPVKQRVLELQTAAADGCKISIQSVCRELDEAIALAKAKGQPNALVNAAGLRAKLGGLLVEKQQVSVTQEPSDFDDAETAEQVLVKVATDLSMKVALALADHFRLPYADEAAILALCNGANGANGSPPGHSQRAIEDWRPPKANRKREL